MPEVLLSFVGNGNSDLGARNKGTFSRKHRTAEVVANIELDSFLRLNVLLVNM